MCGYKELGFVSFFVYVMFPSLNALIFALPSKQEQPQQLQQQPLPLPPHQLLANLLMMLIMTCSGNMQDIMAKKRLESTTVHGPPQLALQIQMEIVHLVLLQRHRQPLPQHLSPHRHRLFKQHRNKSLKLKQTQQIQA